MKLSKKAELDKLKDMILKKFMSENDNAHNFSDINEIMHIIKEKSLSNKYAPWVIREYLQNNIQRFEDMERAKQALILFKNNLSKFTEQQKQLNKMSFQELEMLVEPYQDVLTQNAVKRMNKEKIWSATKILYDGPEGKIVIPQTVESAIFWGKGTKWCTALPADGNYIFGGHPFKRYNTFEPLYVFILPEKDEMGREVKYQLHFPSQQFMNAEDTPVGEEIFDKKLFNIFKKDPDEKQNRIIMSFSRNTNSLSGEFEKLRHGLLNEILFENVYTDFEKFTRLLSAGYHDKELFDIDDDIFYHPLFVKQIKTDFDSIDLDRYIQNIPHKNTDFHQEYDMLSKIFEKNTKYIENKLVNYKRDIGCEFLELLYETNQKVLKLGTLFEIFKKNNIIFTERNKHIFLNYEIHEIKELCYHNASILTVFKDLIDEEIILHVFKNQEVNYMTAQILFTHMDHIFSAEKNTEIFKKIVSYSGRYFNYIPEKYKTDKILKYCEKDDVKVILMLPENEINFEEIEFSYYVILGIPEKYINYEFLKLNAMKSDEPFYCPEHFIQAYKNLNLEQKIQIKNILIQREKISLRSLKTLFYDNSADISEEDLMLLAKYSPDDLDDKMSNLTKEILLSADENKVVLTIFNLKKFHKDIDVLKKFLLSYMKSGEKSRMHIMHFIDYLKNEELCNYVIENATEIFFKKIAEMKLKEFRNNPKFYVL